MKAFVLIGPPGAGKSTYAKQLAKEHNAVVICGDLLRDQLEATGDFEPCWIQIWDNVEESIEENCGLPIILDGTYCRPDYRAEALTLLNTYGYTQVEAIVVNPPLEICIQQNQQRQRQVPEHIIKEMHSSLQRTLRNLHNEGFDYVTEVA